VKTVLLTGATGFLGSHLARALVARGHRVLVLKRPSSNVERIASTLPALSMYAIDGQDLSLPFREHDKVDAVIHAATCNGRNGESAAEIFDANTAFPLRLLETAASFNADVYINSDTVLDKYTNAYALSKHHFLEWGKLYAGAEKIRFVNVRLEHMYGPGDDVSKFTARVIKDCLANVDEIKLTPGNQKRDFIYIDDVVAAYIILLEHADRKTEYFQEFGLGSGVAVTIREFVETVHQLTGSTTRLNFGALPYRQNEIMSSGTDIEALMSLGWRCGTTLANGIRKTLLHEREFYS
jgi:nucleoside-diphosphate-sugar epimerase